MDMRQKMSLKLLVILIMNVSYVSCAQAGLFNKPVVSATQADKLKEARKKIRALKQGKQEDQVEQGDESAPVIEEKVLPIVESQEYLLEKDQPQKSVADKKKEEGVAHQAQEQVQKNATEDVQEESSGLQEIETESVVSAREKRARKKQKRVRQRSIVFDQEADDDQGQSAEAVVQAPLTQEGASDSQESRVLNLVRRMLALEKLQKKKKDDQLQLAVEVEKDGLPPLPEHAVGAKEKFAQEDAVAQQQQKLYAEQQRLAQEQMRMQEMLRQQVQESERQAAAFAQAQDVSAAQLQQVHRRAEQDRERYQKELAEYRSREQERDEQQQARHYQATVRQEAALQKARYAAAQLPVPQQQALPAPVAVVTRDRDVVPERAQPKSWWDTLKGYGSSAVQKSRAVLGRFSLPGAGLVSSAKQWWYQTPEHPDAQQQAVAQEKILVDSQIEQIQYLLQQLLNLVSTYRATPMSKDVLSTILAKIALSTEPGQRVSLPMAFEHGRVANVVLAAIKDLNLLKGRLQAEDLEHVKKKLQAKLDEFNLRIRLLLQDINNPERALTADSIVAYIENFLIVNSGDIL